jgi:hypothetical protein
MPAGTQEDPIRGRALFENWGLATAIGLLIGSAVFVWEAHRDVAELIAAKAGVTRGIYLDIPLWEYVFLAAHVWLIVAVTCALRRKRLWSLRRVRIVLAAYALVLGAGHWVGIGAASAGIHLAWLPWAMHVFP